MLKRLFAFFLAFCTCFPPFAGVAAVLESLDVPPQAAAAGFDHLIFSEDFGAPIDSGAYGGGSHKWYMLPTLGVPLSPTAMAIEDGRIIFTTPEGHRRGLSSRISTISGTRERDSSFLFRFGYIEARMRFDGNMDNWAAFWLLGESRHPYPMNNIKGNWCEIDIVESLDSSRFMATVHDWKDGKSVHNRDHVITVSGVNFNEWNVFGLRWREDVIEWYFNGTFVRSAPVPPICRRERVGIIVGAQKQRGESAQTLEVDYIRVFQ